MTVLSQFSHTLSLTYSTRQQQQSCLMRKASLSLTLPRSFRVRRCACVCKCVCVCRERNVVIESSFALPSQNIIKRESRNCGVWEQKLQRPSLSLTRTQTYSNAYVCWLFVNNTLDLNYSYLFAALKLHISMLVFVFVFVCLCVWILIFPLAFGSQMHILWWPPAAHCHPLARFFCVFVFVLRVCENNPRQLHLVINMALAAIAICFWLKPPPSQFSFTRRENI